MLIFISKEYLNKQQKFQDHTNIPNHQGQVLLAAKLWLLRVLIWVLRMKYPLMSRSEWKEIKKVNIKRDKYPTPIITWQWQAFASIYSYLRVSGSAKGWQFLKIATALFLPAWTHTGWCDFLYGNFQSDISFESHLPQQDKTLTWSQHSYP